MNVKLTILGAFAAATLSAPALTHHSFAMFDRSRDVEVVGTVKAWQFTNPHAYLQVMARYGPGPARELSLEAVGISGLLRRGIRRDSFVPGEQVRVIMHPLRNGAPGGELVEVRSSDGKVRIFYDGQRFTPETVK